MDTNSKRKGRHLYASVKYTDIDECEDTYTEAAASPEYYSKRTALAVRMLFPASKRTRVAALFIFTASVRNATAVAGPGTVKADFRSQSKVKENGYMKEQIRDLPPEFGTYVRKVTQ